MAQINRKSIGTGLLSRVAVEESRELATKTVYDVAQDFSESFQMGGLTAGQPQVIMPEYLAKMALKALVDASYHYAFEDAQRDLADTVQNCDNMDHLKTTLVEWLQFQEIITYVREQSY
jgi:hypothetical protein